MDLIQLNYLKNDDNTFLPEKENIIPYFEGHNSPSFFSFFWEPDVLIDVKTNTTIDTKKATATNTKLDTINTAIDTQTNTKLDTINTTIGTQTIATNARLDTSNTTIDTQTIEMLNKLDTLELMDEIRKLLGSSWAFQYTDKLAIDVFENETV